ncbi:MAG TPA: TonB-dependent receptor [Sphingobacteriaceae bacterium]
MRINLIVVFLTCALFQVNAESFAQRISLKQKNASLETVLTEVTRQTGFNVLCDGDLIKQAQSVDVNFKDASVNEVFSKFFPGIAFNFSIKNNTIAVSRNTTVPVRSERRAINIRGTVTSSNGETLPGVSIQIKGTGTGTVSDINGNYVISVPDENSVLVFSYVGFMNQEIEVGNRTSIDVILKELPRNLNEVVVVGYGAVARGDITGAVGEVNVASITQAPVASFDKALAGRVAGVQVSSAEDGQPGEGMNIIIRGSNSLTQDNSPLYVIDGFPMESPETAGINPDDIESINILKDASATAIYGARAANGVIVIETKKGKVGKPVFTFNTSIGTESASKMMDMLTPYEFVQYEVERYGLAGTQLRYFDNGKTLDSYANAKGIDWQDQLFGKGFTQIHNIALRGGSPQTRYSISGSAYDSDAIITNTGFRRYQTRFSIDQTVNNKIKAGLNANFSNQKGFGQILGRTSATSETSISGYLLYSVWGYRPITGNDDATDDLIDDLLDEELDGADDFRINPILSAENTLRERITNNLTANAFVTYDIAKDFELKVTGGLNGVGIRTNQFYNSMTVRGTPLRPNNINGINGSISNRQRLDWLNENTLTYNKRFSGGHRLNILGGVTLQGIRNTADGFSAIQVMNEELGINGLAQGMPLETTSNASENRLLSFISRVNYNYKSKYLLTATMRADGSSKFAPNNRWGYFPSAAFAWRLSQEKFMKGVPAISDAKIRTSYGVTGNNRVRDFSYLPSISQDDLASYSFNNTRYQGLNMDNLSNSDLKWESTAQADIGLDLSLFKSRVNFIADWYRKTTSNLLLNAQLPYTTGYSSSYKNIGKVRNEGIELTLNTINYQSKAFSWESNFNISFNKNRILELTENQTNMLSRISAFVTRMAQEPLYIAEVGKPAAMFYGLIWDGVYQYSDFDEPSPDVYVLKNNVPTNGDLRSSIQPGDIKYKDINNDGVVDASDKTVIGRALPVHTGGFYNNFSFKGFDLNVLMQWSAGNQLMNANRLIFEGNATNVHHFNQYASWANRWTPENPSNTLFRSGGAGPQVMSSRTLEDGSYLRLKTVSLSYNIPKSVVSRLKMSALSLNVAAQNLYTWTDYSGMDPEVSVHNTVLTPGFDFSAYPHARTLVFGLKARF